MKSAIRVCAVVCLAASSAAVWGQGSVLKGPSATSKQVMQAAAGMLPKNHLSQRQLDDDLSRRWLTAYLASLDGTKAYFEEGDIRQFMTRRDELDDQAKQGSVGFAYEVFKTYVTRTEERLTLARELLEAPIDFSAEEEYPLSPDKGNYPANGEEARERWGKMVKAKMLEKKAAGFSEEDARAQLTRRFENLLAHIKQMNDDDVLELYLSAMAGAYDPHSSYMSAQTVRGFEISNRQQLDGIGAQLRSVDGEIIVLRLPPGGPAHRDGRLKPDDRIVGVGQGENGPIEEVVGKKFSDVVDKIRGKGGTVVRLQVIPKGQAERVIYNIVRGKVQADAARGSTVEWGRKGDGKPYRFGVISLESLYSSKFQGGGGTEQVRSSTSDLRRLLADPQRGFKSAGVDAVILDLRSNIGGVLTEAVYLPGLFVGKAATLQVRGSDGKIETYNSEEESAWDGPLIVLTSRLTASGAEIIAAVIQDCGRGLIIGDAGTAGNGSVQSMFDVGASSNQGANAPKLGQMKITTQQFYRVSGESTQNRGIIPDVVLPSLTDGPENSEAFRPNALPFDVVEALNHPSFGLVRPEIKSELTKLSHSRRVASPEYGQLESERTKLAELRARDSISLNEATGLEEFSLLNRGNATPEAGGKLGEDFQSREILEIAVDYVRMLKQ